MNPCFEQVAFVGESSSRRQRINDRPIARIVHSSSGGIREVETRGISAERTLRVRGRHAFCHWWGSLTRSVACLLTFVSCTLPDGRSQAQLIPTLDLSLERSVRLPVTQQIGGALVLGRQSLWIWTADGEVFEESSGEFVRRSSRSLEEWKVRAASLDSSQEAIAIVSRKGEIGATVLTRPQPPRVLIQGKLLSAEISSRGMSLLVHDGVSKVVLAKYSTSGSLLSTRAMTAAKDEVVARRLYAIGSNPKVTLLAESGDSLRLTCVRSDSLVSESSVPIARLADFSPDIRSNAAWVATTVLPVDDAFMVSLSDLRSTDRASAIVDASCRINRVTKLPPLIIPIAVSTSGRQLVAADYRGEKQLLVFNWRWGALAK